MGREGERGGEGGRDPSESSGLREGRGGEREGGILASRGEGEREEGRNQL